MKSNLFCVNSFSLNERQRVNRASSMSFRISKFVFTSPAISVSSPMKSTVTDAPRCTACRAATNPSPPFFPFPATTRTFCSRHRAKTMFNLLDDRASCIFHQKKRRHSELADRQFVYFLHLLRIDQRKHEYSKKENRPFNSSKNGRYKFPNEY